MDALRSDLSFVASQGNFVPPDLHMKVRKWFTTNRGEGEEVDLIFSFVQHILSPLLQEESVPTHGEIELLDILGTLLSSLGNSVASRVAKFILTTSFDLPWATSATVALYNTFIHILTFDSTKSFRKKMISLLTKKITTICDHCPEESLPNIIKALMNSTDQVSFNTEQASEIVKICLHLLPRISDVDLPAVFYLIELSFQFSRRLPTIVLDLPTEDTNKRIHPRETKDRCLLLLLLSSLRRYKDLCFQNIENHLNRCIISSLSNNTPETCLDICFELIDDLVGYAGMESRSSILVDCFFFIIENSMTTNQEIAINVPIHPLDSSAASFHLFGPEKIPVVLKVAEYGLLQCFVRWDNSREFILKEMFGALRAKAPASSSHSSISDPMAYAKQNSSLISVPALLYTELFGVIGGQFPGCLAPFQHLLYEWLVELPFLRFELSSKIQSTCLSLIRTHPGLIDQILIFSQKQMHSNSSLERILSLRGLLTLFSFYSGDEKREQEFLLILKTSLSLPLLYRKTVYSCLREFLSKDNEESFPMPMKIEILRLLEAQLSRYFSKKDAEFEFCISSCFRALPTLKTGEYDLQPKELLSDLLDCVILLSSQSSMAISLIDSLYSQITTTNSLHLLVFSSTDIDNDSADSNKSPISKDNRLELLLPVFQTLIDWKCKDIDNGGLQESLQTLLHHYTILLYARYHTQPNCKWNAHWDLYLEPGPETPLSFESAILLSLHFVKKFLENPKYPLLNIYIQLRWLFFYLHSPTFPHLEIKHVKDIITIISLCLCTFNDPSRSLPLTTNHRYQLVQFDVLLALLPVSRGVYETLVLHNTSKDTSDDLLGSIECLALQLFDKVISLLLPSQKDELTTHINLSFHLQSKQTGSITWFLLSELLLSWLKKSFQADMEMRDDMLQANVNLLITCHDPFCIRYNYEQTIILLEKISDQWLDILRRFRISQPKILRLVVHYLLHINPLPFAIPIARLLLFSLLTQPEEGEEDDDARLLVGESKACISSSFKVVLEFYHSSLGTIKENVKERVKQCSEPNGPTAPLLWLIEPEKRILGDLLKLLHFIMTAKMEFMDKHNQTSSFLRLIRALLLSLSFFFSSMIKKDSFPLLCNEFDVPMMVQEEALALVLSVTNSSPQEFPFAHVLLLLHSSVTFCYALHEWMVQYRAYLNPGKLPELIHKKVNFISIAETFVCFIKNHFGEKLPPWHIHFLCQSIQFTNQQSTTHGSALSVEIDASLRPKRPTRKRKRIISSQNSYINEALQESHETDPTLIQELASFIDCRDESQYSDYEYDVEENTTQPEITPPKKRIKPNRLPEQGE